MTCNFGENIIGASPNVKGTDFNFSNYILQMFTEPINVCYNAIIAILLRHFLLQMHATSQHNRPYKNVTLEKVT